MLYVRPHHRFTRTCYSDERYCIGILILIKLLIRLIIMKGSILLSMIVPWAVLAAPLADQQPSRTVNVEARAPGAGGGRPLSDWYNQPGQEDVPLDSWGRPIDGDGFDVYGQPATRPTTSASATRVAPPLPAWTPPRRGPGPNPFADRASKFDKDDLALIRMLMTNHC